ncbi:N-6 DNA methylase [Brevundimonas sp.]|jgi:type I restriction enzyme M protein|uniref:class I SAM-dependent DNA methyltransferase n=1 Tax=Brevundimonas sp. TaxID=1871086 RepID=UPI0037C082D9
MSHDSVVQKIWGLCHILRGDGVSYHEYISELTYLLFLKMAEETGTENLLPIGYRWNDLAAFDGDDLLSFYREMLTFLGGHANSEVVRRIYAFPTTVFSHSENLKAVIDGISKIEWHSVSADEMGRLYEGLLAKNSQDSRSGAGQYFTPRALVDCIVELVQPTLGEVVQDPAAGSGGFLISADHYVRSRNSVEGYDADPPLYEGVEIEKSTYRICLMNAFLHRLRSKIILGDALTADALELSPPDVVLANPPFGAKAGSARKLRDDISSTTNKQLAFLQHIYLSMKAGGRAAVVLPDNVLFEEGIGRKIRQDLMERCDLHTILRLPTGIFYSPGVKTNVLFFSTRENDEDDVRTDGATKRVWVYDMRHDVAKYGKKRTLTRSDFEHFIAAYGEDPQGQSERTDTGPLGRWRMFSRETIAERGDNLDLTWFADRNGDDQAADEPEDILADLLHHLHMATEEIKAVLQDLSADAGPPTELAADLSPSHE